MKIDKVRLIPFILFALLVFFLWKGLSSDKKLPSVQIGQKIADFTLPTLNNQGTFSPQQMLGDIAILNVWASWCATCSSEQDYFAKLSQSGIHIYGLNYKDDPKRAATWLETWGNPYLIVGYDESGKTAIDLGVYGAPETFLIDQNGIIQHRHLGLVNKDVWKKEFVPRIKKLRLNKK